MIGASATGDEGMSSSAPGSTFRVRGLVCSARQEGGGGEENEHELVLELLQNKLPYRRRRLLWQLWYDM